MKMIATVKHSSLFCRIISDGDEKKSFYNFCQQIPSLIPTPPMKKNQIEKKMKIRNDKQKKINFFPSAR
jgi:hypothetical protein